MHIDNLGSCDRLAARFRMLKDPDATALMVSWMGVIRDDNKKGAAAGLDKDGHPLAPVTYRPVGPGKEPSNRIGKFQPLVLANFGSLTTSEYRRLAGPPLAPRGKQSRVVTNLLTEYGRGSQAGTWEAFGYWDQVFSRGGMPFLQYHFHGIGQKKRDLTGVRPEGVLAARKRAVNWIIDMVRSGGV
jgi:hypothetical protein